MSKDLVRKTEIISKNASNDLPNAPELTEVDEAASALMERMLLKPQSRSAQDCPRCHSRARLHDVHG